MGNITSEYELDVYCSNHTDCDGNCILCPAFAEWFTHEHGMDEHDNELEDEE